MPNKTKKRQYNNNLSAKLAKLLDFQLKQAVIVDSITRVIGIEKVRAELDVILAEQKAKNEHVKTGTSGTESEGMCDGAQKRADEKDGQGSDAGNSG